MSSPRSSPSRPSVDQLDSVSGGWFRHYWVQLVYQLADSTAGISYSFAVTPVVLMHLVPGLRLRCDDETEILGVDDAELGEFAYDYVGLAAELGAHLPQTSSGPGVVSADVAAIGAVGGGRAPDHIHQPLVKEDHRDSSSESEKEKEKPTA